MKHQTVWTGERWTQPMNQQESGNLFEKQIKSEEVIASHLTLTNGN